MIFKITPHNIEIKDKVLINKGEYKATKFYFEFSNEYTDDLVKKAIFKDGNNNYEMVIDHNECDIPSEILQKRQIIVFGVYAYKINEDELELRYSPCPIQLTIVDGSYDPNTISSEEITPSQFEQYNQKLQDGLNKIEISLKRIDDKSQEIVDVEDEVEANEKLRVEHEEKRQENEDKRIENEEKRQEIFDTFKTKLDNGEFKGDKGDTGEIGPQGPIGPQGQAFTITKTYPSIKDMEDDFNNIDVGSYIMIASSVELEDNAKLYYHDKEKWVYITDFSGATGIQGEQGIQGIQGIQGPVGPAGPKPIKGVDYFTSTDKEELVNSVTSDATNSFNANVNAKTKEFNDNASEKTNEFNGNVEAKTKEFDSVTTNYVKNTDYATAGAGGVVKTSGRYGLEIDENGKIYPSVKSLEEYKKIGTPSFVSKGTLNNVLSEYVKSTDYALSNKVGVVRVGNGSATNDSGTLFAVVRTKENYDRENSNFFIGKGTLENVRAYDKSEQEKINESLRKENSMLWKNQLPAEAEGQDIHIEDSAEMKCEIDLLGDIEQNSTTGKNLLPINAVDKVMNGITFKINEDKTVLVNGTATDDAFLILVPSYFSLNNDSYKLTGCPLGGGSSTYRLYIQQTGLTNSWIDDFGNGGVKTLPSGKQYESRILIKKGTICKDLIFKPMIRLATITDDTYEPYTGGQPSPNPEYPQDVQVVTGDNEIEVGNKNLVGLLDITNRTNNGIVENVNSGRVVLNGTATNNAFMRIDNIRDVYFSLKAGTYTMSANNSVALGSNDLLIFVDKSGTAIGELSVSLNTINATRTFTINEDLEEIQLQVRITRGTTLNNYILLPQLEIGSQATEYEPYQSASYPISLGNIELCKIGNYKDRIYPLNGKWYLEKKIGKVVLNGSESGWHTSSLVVTGYKSYYVDSSVRINQDALGSKCNYFEYKTYNEWQSLLKATFIENTYQAIGIRVVETLAPTLEDFKTWLSTHNTIAYFVLATPTKELITDKILISQLNAIYEARTYKNVTNITTDTENEKPIIKLKYYKDLETTLNNLQAMIVENAG